MTPYRIDRWSERGITTSEATTKREANRLAQAMRNDPSCSQTVVTFPNGAIKVCRNTKAKATK